MKLSTVKQSVRYPELYVHKYTNKVFYKNLWDEELVELRGKVCLEDGTVVVNPFTKIFNRKENDTNLPLDEPCIVVEKVNGFMAAATYVKEVGEVVVSTTGSLDSPFAQLAEKYVTKDIKDLIKAKWVGYTLLFEVCDPNNKHIVYEVPGLYLIGIRAVADASQYFSDAYREKMLDGLAKTLGVMRPKWELSTFVDVVRANRVTQREGVVVYGQQSVKVLKLKSPYYIALKAAARVKDISKLDKSRVAEEFYPLIDNIRVNAALFTTLDEQSRLHYMKNYIKEYYNDI
jgi:hypothetical protein